MIRSVGYQFLSPLLFWIWSLWLLHSHIGSMCVTKNALVSMQVCPICLTNAKDLAFGCGHMVRRNSESLLHSVFNNVMQPHPENMHGYLCFGCVWVLCEKKNSVAGNVGRASPDARYVDSRYGRSWGYFQDEWCRFMLKYKFKSLWKNIAQSWIRGKPMFICEEKVLLVCKLFYLFCLYHANL
jgi:hypothetical protein